MRIKTVLYLLGALVICVGLSLALPILVALFYGENNVAGNIGKAMACGLAAGGLCMFISRPQGQMPAMTNREGLAVVGFGWIAVCLAGALPYMFGANMGLVRAFFESSSGFTTTGATILTDIEAMPRGLLFWRSQTHLLGGMGIIVFSLAILPFLGTGGMQLFRAEVTGPKADKLAPRIKDTARYLWGVYLLLTALLTMLLMLGGMDWFDAVNHAFSTMGTGGFSTRNASIAAFPSPYIQWVIILFMFVAGMNFTLHFFALRGHVKAYARNTECLSYCALVLLGGVTIALLNLWNGGGGVESAFRAAFFQVISICTTTGFVTQDYLLWPFACQTILLLFLLMGACAGSTAGGLKVMRVVIVARAAWQELRRIIHPRSVERLKLDGRIISPEVFTGIVAFTILYIFLALGGMLFLSACGEDLLTAFSAAATCLSNVGPGFGKVGPVYNFAFLPESALTMLSFLMILGRLEIFAILALLLPSFWRL